MEKVSKKNKWCYSTGCIGRDMTYTLVALFLMTFLQYTAKLTSAQFSVIVVVMVLCRVWDAINDPMMGTIITNTKSKYGKYRPWVLIGAITNAVVLVLMFSIHLEGWAYVALFSTLYLLWGMTFTMNDVSFWSILPALAKEKKERDSLTTMLAVFASVGAFIAGGLVPILTTGNAIVAYRIIAIVFASVFLLCQIMVFCCVRENSEDDQPKEKITLKKMIKVIANNKQLVWMALVVLTYSLGSALLNSFGQNYFYIEFGYQGSYMLIFTVVYAVGTLVSQGIFAKLASKYKRAQLTKISMIALIAGYVCFFIISLISFGELAMVKLAMLCVFGILIFAGQGVFYMNMLVMLANTIEYDQWNTGVRNESIIFSVRPFMVKLAGAFEYLIILATLLLTGIKTITDNIADLEIQKAEGIKTDIVEEASALLEQVTYQQKVGLVAAMTIIPIILFLIAWWVVSKKYIIDEDFYEKMMKDIEDRKQKEAKIA